MSKTFSHLLFLCYFTACSGSTAKPAASSLTPSADAPEEIKEIAKFDLEAFPRTSDYDYQLATMADARAFEVQLSDSGFAWPEGMETADTIFLEFQLSGTEGAEPSILARAKRLRAEQYFTEGGQGRRYLDLSSFAGAGLSVGEKIALVSQGARWNKGTAKVVTFSNAPMANRRVLVVAAHPDDAELAAFGVYQSSRADVVTVTAGELTPSRFAYLWGEDKGTVHREKGRIRVLDSLTVPAFGGVQPDHVRNLGYYDATLGTLWKERPKAIAPFVAKLDNPAYFRRLNFDEELRNREFSSTWQALVADMLRELERVQPESIVTAHPMLDRHPDHQFSTIALFEALAQWGGSCDVLLYTNHATGNESWPLGPRQAMMGLPPWQGEGLHLRRIYSHPLSDEDQRRKLIALEAMHDLRTFDLRDETTPEPPGRGPLYDYFRRAARPNELFLVTDPDGAAAIYRDFTSSLKK